MTLIFHAMFFSGKCPYDGLIRAMMLIVFSANFPYDAYYVYDVYSGVESRLVLKGILTFFPDSA